MYRPITKTHELPVAGAAYETTMFDMKGWIRKTLGIAPNARFDAFEMAKDVAAFASAMGGTVLVGAMENQVTHLLTGYAPIPETDAHDIKAAFEIAVKNRCKPVPVFSCEVMQNPPNSGYVVAVNVDPFPTQLIGVRLMGDKTDGFGGDAHVFPIRVGTHTTLLQPEQLPMYMQSESRRAAILLDRLPQKLAQFFFMSGGATCDLTVDHIDLDADSVTLHDSNNALICIPLGAIRHVWLDPAEKRWRATVEGRLHEWQNKIAFLPLGH